MLTFTNKELAVLFHALNNSYGPSAEAAAERAFECDGIERMDYFHTLALLVARVGNAGD